MNKKLKSLIGISLVIFLVMGLGITLKNIFLHQVKKKIKDNFDYTQLQLSIFPPALVIEDVRTTSLFPFFSAKKVEVKISYTSLLKNEKPLRVFIDEPILIIHAESQTEGKEGKSISPIPFAIENGLIRGGKFYYWGKDNNFQAKDIKALFTQKKRHFSFLGEAEEATLSSISAKKTLQGNVSLSIEGRDNEVKIKKMRIYGSGFVLKAEGNILNIRDPEITLKTSLKVETSLIASLLNLPFEWDGKAEGEGILKRKGGSISFLSDYSSDGLTLNRVHLGRVRGKVEVMEGMKGSVEFNIQKGFMPEEYVRINFSKSRIEGIARRFHLDPIVKYTGLPWPIISPAWGNFIIDEKKLVADIEFRDEFLEAVNDKFPFQGRVTLSWNKKDKFSFSSQRLRSSFALVDVEGSVEVNKDVDLSIQGDVSDIKQARHFTSLILVKNFSIPEIRGKGRASLKILGSYSSPQVKANFSLSPAGFDKFNVNRVEGNAEIIKNDFIGKFRVNDPFMEGRISLLSNQEGLEAEIHLVQGSVEEILPGLDIHLPLKGRGSGDFTVRQIDDNTQVEGIFTSPLMKISSQNLRDVSGKLGWRGGAVTFSEFQCNILQGTVKGFAHIGLLDRVFNVDIQGENINCASFYSPLKGDLSFSLKGEGILDRDRAPGKFEIKDFIYAPFQKTDVKGEVKLGFSEEKLAANIEGNFFPGENEFYVELNMPFNQESLTADVRGTFRNLDLLLPWKGTEGQINYLAEVKAGEGSPRLKGVIDFKGSVFPLPKFAHAFRDYSGLMFVEDGKVSLRSLQGKLGGGDVWGSGEIKLGKQGIENVDLKIEGKNLLVSPLERTRVLTDGSLRVIKNSERFDLDGDFFVDRLSWRRELNEKFIFYSTPYYQSRTEPGVFDDLNLNIRIKADDNAWMQNSLGKIEGKFDLSITGNVNAPIVTGSIEALQGDVYFQDRKFRILRGRVSFINPSIIEPYLEFKGEAHVKDYRVTFSLNGLLDRLNPEFSSSPPLPPEDVLALLAMGEAFKRTYSYDRSTQLGTASLLSFHLAEEAKKRAEKIFRIDRFRIDPFVMGSSAETTARLTVGKKISRNFFILYSTNLSTQREEFIRLEWELTGDLSVVGIRDEEGRFSFDVKIYKRF
ncbi:MAG: translocation/assembly module TamB domain-containing protein [Candidatus Aminicenantaceae bacterium]